VHDPDAEGAVRFADVLLESVLDLRTGQGTLFDARGGLQMAGFTVVASAEDGDDFGEMRDRTRGSAGHGMSPRMQLDRDRFVAEDLGTLTYFTVWAGLERAWALAEEIGDTSGATTEHALVGIDAQVVAAEIFPLPILTSDNAAYAAPLDAWLTLRVTSQEGVPFAMSLPVLAHELHHRVFHRNVFGRDEAFAFWRQRLGEPSEEEQRATRILQGIDEGLADLFSLAVTGDVPGLPRAFELAGGRFVPEAARRDLEGRFADEASYDGLRTNTLDVAHLRACSSTGTDDLFSEAGFNFYCLGTVLARALWDGAGRDLEVLRGETLPAVIRALPRLGDTIATGAIVDVDAFLSPLVEEIPPGARRAAVCAALAPRFSSIFDAGAVPSCP
jgi:hypothetical protein